MAMPDDQETQNLFWLLLVVFVIGALLLVCGYFGRWAPGGP